MAVRDVLGKIGAFFGRFLAGSLTPQDAPRRKSEHLGEHLTMIAFWATYEGRVPLLSRIKP